MSYGSRRRGFRRAYLRFALRFFVYLLAAAGASMMTNADLGILMPWLFLIREFVRHV